MKSQLDLSNKRHVGILLMPVWFVLLGIQIMEHQATERTIGFIALGIVIVSTIVLFKSNVYRRRVVALCVGVTGLAFLMGHLLTTLILG